MEIKSSVLKMGQIDECIWLFDCDDILSGFICHTAKNKYAVVFDCGEMCTTDNFEQAIEAIKKKTIDIYRAKNNNDTPAHTATAIH